MAIQHKDIPDANLHEPKGVASSGLNTVYVSNGAGTGVWKVINTTVIKGLELLGGFTNRRVVTDGANGLTTILDAAYGSMTITGNSANFAMTAAVDPTLATTSDYVLFTGTGAGWVSENLSGITFSTNRLTVPVTGIYRIDLWASINSFPTNTAKIGARYRINGATFSTRYPIVKSNSAGDEDTLAGFGLISLAANDFIQLYLASTATGNLVVKNANTTLTLIKQTA